MNMIYITSVFFLKFQFLLKILANFSSRGCLISNLILAHIFRGLSLWSLPVFIARISHWSLCLMLRNPLSPMVQCIRMQPSGLAFFSASGLFHAGACFCSHFLSCFALYTSSKVFFLGTCLSKPNLQISILGPGASSSDHRGSIVQW